MKKFDIKMPIIKTLTLCSLVVLCVPNISDGLPINRQDEDVPRRVARSLHAIHQRLCPVGIGSERCFMKHLSIFASITKPIDPVEQRNIGKRSESLRKPSKTMLTFTENDVKAFVDQLEPEMLNDLLQVLLQEDDIPISNDELLNTLSKLRGYDDSKEASLNKNHIWDFSADTPIEENAFEHDWDVSLKKKGHRAPKRAKTSVDMPIGCFCGGMLQQCFKILPVIIQCNEENVLTKIFENTKNTCKTDGD